MTPDKVKNDRFRRKRGGTSVTYHIRCANCNFDLLTYQKDGVGTLRRLYVDRIISANVGTIEQALACASCDTIIGQRYIYVPEQRLAYRLIPGAYRKLKK